MDRNRIKRCSQVLWAFFVGFPAGVTWGSWPMLPGVEWGVLALLCIGATVWPQVVRSWLVFGAVAGVMTGMIHIQGVLHDRLGWQTDFREASIRGEARVVGEWSRNSFSASVPIAWERCVEKACPSMRSLLQLPIEEGWLPGERLRVNCRLTLPKNISEDFDYRAYLAKENIGTICIPTQPPEVLPGASWETGVFRLRMALERSLAQSVPEPENGFLAGLIFGGSQRLPSTLQDDFKKTGVSHIVAVSGYNVLIVAEALLALGIVIGLWRWQAVWFALIGIWLFALMTGAGASVVRAATMATIVLLATQSGRLVAPWRLMILMLTLLLWVNPLLLRYDIGFQLSCIATAVLLFFFLSSDDSPQQRSSWWYELRQLLVATLAIEVCVAPILLTQFGFVSTVSLLTNALLLPLVPVAMMLAFATAVTGLVLPGAVNIFAWSAYMVAVYMVEVVTRLGAWSGSTFGFQLGGWGIVVWYTMIAVGWYLFKK